MFAEGSNGSVELSGESIIIRRKGIANILTQGLQGDKQIPLKNITAVQFRSAGSMMAGLIQFSILGGQEFRGGMLEATKDENAVMFTREQEPAFAELRVIVQERLSQLDRTFSGGSPAEELERLAALLEKGHLTSDEFADAKKRILGDNLAKPSASPNPVQTPAPTSPEVEKKGGCLKQVLVAFAFIVGFLILVGIANPGPKWGEPGYNPKISDDCRAIWASINVDADKYLSAVCTQKELHEIAGYRPK